MPTIWIQTWSLCNSAIPREIWVALRAAQQTVNTAHRRPVVRSCALLKDGSAEIVMDRRVVASPSPPRIPTITEHSRRERARALKFFNADVRLRLREFSAVAKHHLLYSH